MIIHGREFTIGADPEFFIQKNGKVCSAYNLIKGTKDHPLPVNGGAVQVDGMALEFNVDPSRDSDELSFKLSHVRKQLMDMLPEFQVCEEASVIFDEDTFREAPREALRLGCEPDYNAVTGEANCPPQADSRMRTAGGHIHIGGFHTEDPMHPVHFNACRRLTKFMDEQLGVYSLLWDHDDKRREMYGKASCFRPKSYGMEYRTLSNKWIFNSNLVEVVFQCTRDAITQMFNKKRPEPSEEIYQIINTSNRDHKIFKGLKARWVMEKAQCL